jgi:tRNA-binding EMAP/Myf-like protein
MKVDCGEFGLRQILSGVRPSIQSIDLIGKQSLFIVNLKPRKVMGFESQGMMLSAAYLENEERKLNRLVLVDQIINGSLIG